MTFSVVSYAIGAVFLLATLLVLASRSGILPAGLVGKKLFPILAGVVVFLAVNFNAGPYFAARWRSLWPSAVKGAPSVNQTPAPRAEPPRVPLPAIKAVTQAKVRKRPAADLTGVIVTRGSDAESSESQAGMTTPAEPSLPAPDPVGATPVTSADHAGRFKHAVKSVGHFLHITRGAAEEQRERPF